MAASAWLAAMVWLAPVHTERIAVAPAVSTCQTLVHDTQPPTNVRATPHGSVVTTLANGTVLTVDRDESGWLHIAAPVRGWVHVSVTQVRCFDPRDTHAFKAAAIDALGRDALHYPIAGDTVRVIKATAWRRRTCEAKERFGTPMKD